MHKSTFVKLAAAALVASAFSLPASAADVIKLGVAGPHSGDLAPYGLPSKDAAEMVVAEVNAAGGRAQLVAFPEAGHAFNADYRPSYREKEAKEGWAMMLAWFKTNGV